MNKFKDMERSNLRFLSADGVITFEQSPVFSGLAKTHQTNLTAINNWTDAELAKVTSYDTAGMAKRNSIFAETENKVKIENERYAIEVKKARAKYNLDYVISRGQNLANSTTTVLDSLGIEAPASQNKAPISGKDNKTVETGGLTTTQIILYAVGGLAVVGGIVYLVMRNKG